MTKSKVEKPVIILGCPRSGTTLLLALLTKSKGLHSLYNESHFIFKKFYKTQKARFNKVYDDDSIPAEELTDEWIDFFHKEFEKHSFSNDLIGGFVQKILMPNPYLKWLGELIASINYFWKKIFAGKFSFVEKTPRNAFRVAFLNKLFPDCKFLYLQRDGKSTISSLIEGWRKLENTPGGRGVRKIRPLSMTNYTGKFWRYTRPPGWGDYVNGSLEEACAFQWKSANEKIIKDLESIPEDRKFVVKFEELIERPGLLMEQICEFAEIPFSRGVQKACEKLPVVSNFGTQPSKDKWKRNEDLINNIAYKIEPLMKRLGYEMPKEEELVR